MTAAVIDTTVLSNFAHVKQPDLLQQAFDELVAPTAVMDEWREGVRLGAVPAVDWNWLPEIGLTGAEQLTAEEFGQTLGRGEAACLALAVSRGWIVLTDDQNARKAARKAGLMVSGTLGALMNLIHLKVITVAEGDLLLSEMMLRGYHSPVDSLSELDND